jgi:NAD-dependent histone deacetylase SIR2
MCVHQRHFSTSLLTNFSFEVYAFASSFDPTKFRPTLAHSFLRLLDTKGLLHTCFTQNIDGLEGRAHIPEDKIVEAHGSVASQRCANCRAPYDGDRMWAAVHAGRVAYCEREGCGGPVKSDIVFFGEVV